MNYYPSINASVDPANPRFASLDDSGPTAVIESQFGTGQQQRAENVYAEITSVCPSYWLAEAFTGKGRTACKYQHSVPAAQRGSEVAVYFGPAAPTNQNIPLEFRKPFMCIWGTFIMHDDPSISSLYVRRGKRSEMRLLAERTVAAMVPE